MTERAAGALRWIVGLLRSHAVPFQVVGGLAARAYGSTRPLVDIDLYVPDDRLEEIALLTADYVVRRPAHHRDSHWNITFMALDFQGQRIELGGAGGEYHDSESACWRSAEVDFEASEVRKLFGVSVPVMPRAQLVECKRRLGRPVDVEDVAELEAGRHGRLTT